MGGKGTTGNYSMYVNPFMVVNSMKFTKHFYIEGQRIVSKLGDMGENQELLNPKDTTRAGNNGNHPIDWDNKHEHLKDQLIANFEDLGLTGAVFTAGKSGKVPYGQRRSPREHIKNKQSCEQIKKYYRNPNSIFNGVGNDSTNNNSSSGNKAELLQFYYHPDHLGSSNFITNVSGEVYQHMEYFPFGETFIEERNGTDYTNYLYNGKEFDEEIGLYYYGARYYDPRISMWYGVDPMLERHYDWTPYAYVLNNPLNFIDPNGMTDFKFDKKTGEVTQVGEANNEPDRILKTNRKGEVKYKRNGEAKVAIDDIDQGILSDGMNFKTDDNIIEVGEEKQPTLEGVENFLVELSDHVDVEIAAASLSGKNQKNVSAVYIDEYASNSEDRATITIKQNYIGNAKYNTHYHSHLSRFDPNAKYEPSKQDFSFKAGQSKYFKKFIILSDHPNGPIEY